MPKFDSLENNYIRSKSELEPPVELRDDFDGQSLGKIWELDRLPPNGYQQVDAPDRPGEKAVELTVHPGDFLRQGPAAGQIRERCEIGEKAEYFIKPGANIWYGLSFYIPKNFLVVDNRLVIAQWRNNKTTKRHENPPLALRYINGELRFTIKNEDEWITLFNEPNAEKGAWHDLLVNYQWNKDHSGYCGVALDGADKGKYEGHIGYDHLPAEMHFRMGLYRDHLEEPQSLLFSRFRRGASREFCEK
ncbi:MAG: heparin lyase I family protein [Patescibacteria group bacterium]